MRLLVCQVLFPLIDETVCVNEAKARHADAVIAANFKGCSNDSALVCTLTAPLIPVF